MADFIEGMVELFQEDAALAALVGDRVFVDHAPGGGGDTSTPAVKFPYLVVSLISEPRATASGLPDGTAKSRVQLTGYAKTSEVAQTVAVAAKDASLGGDGAYVLGNGVRVLSALVLDRRSGYDVGARAYTRQIDVAFENTGD